MVICHPPIRDELDQLSQGRTRPNYRFRVSRAYTGRIHHFDQRGVSGRNGILRYAKKTYTDEKYRQNIGVKPVNEYYGYESETDML